MHSVYMVKTFVLGFHVQNLEQYNWKLQLFYSYKLIFLQLLGSSFPQNSTIKFLCRLNYLIGCELSAVLI